ncbi:glutamyl aminopeptidase, partial [Trichonephila inaurata madagascariensis]
YVWHIPLTYRTYNSNEVSQLLLNSSEKVYLPESSTEWIKFRRFQRILLRQLRPLWMGQDHWLLQDKKTQHDFTIHRIFSPADRVNLLYDSFSLASAGHVSYDVPLRLIGYLKHEKYHGAWRVAVSELNILKSYFKADREVRELIKVSFNNFYDLNPNPSLKEYQ